MTAINTKIKYFYDNKVLLFDSGDYDCFHMGVQHTISLPLSQKKIWLSNMALRAQTTQKDRIKTVKQMKPITEYFPVLQFDDDQQQD